MLQRLRIQEHVLQDVVVVLLGDEDTRVRQAAATSLTKWVTYFFLTSPITRKCQNPPNLVISVHIHLYFREFQLVQLNFKSPGVVHTLHTVLYNVSTQLLKIMFAVSQLNPRTVNSACSHLCFWNLWRPVVFFTEWFLGCSILWITRYMTRSFAGPRTSRVVTLSPSCMSGPVLLSL